MASQEGSESAARNYFDSEIKKWMAGESNTVSTMQSRIQSLEEPISYDIRSVVDGDPDFLACQDAAKLPNDWKTWPAYKLNVAIAGYIHDDATASGILKASGISDAGSVCPDAINLNNLDDWQEFHAAELR